MDQLAFLMSLRPSHRARYFALLVINRVMAVFEQYLSHFKAQKCLLVGYLIVRCACQFRFDTPGFKVFIFCMLQKP